MVNLQVLLQILLPLQLPQISLQLLLQLSAWLQTRAQIQTASMPVMDLRSAAYALADDAGWSLIKTSKIAGRQF